MVKLSGLSNSTVLLFYFGDFEHFRPTQKFRFESNSSNESENFIFCIRNVLTLQI